MLFLFSCRALVYRLPHRSLKTAEIFANPITQDGSNYRGDISEDEAFLWFDEAQVHVRAGSGGAGASTYKFGRPLVAVAEIPHSDSIQTIQTCTGKNRQHAAPSGGSGGDGGNVVFFSDENFNTLFGFRGRSSFRAENGIEGQLDFFNGQKGTDTMVPVPLGTHFYDNRISQLTFLR